MKYYPTAWKGRRPAAIYADEKKSKRRCCVNVLVELTGVPAMKIGSVSWTDMTKAGGMMPVKKRGQAVITHGVTGIRRDGGGT